MKTLNESVSRVLRLGDVSGHPFLVTPAGRLDPDSVVDASGAVPGIHHVALTYGNRFREDLFFRLFETHIECRRSTVNLGPDATELVETGFEWEGLRIGKDSRHDYFYHVENPRIYSRMTMPVDARRTQDEAKDGAFDVIAGNRWADPGVVSERIGDSPYQPFPAILLSNRDTTQGLVHGSLEQRVFYHNYLVSHRGGAICLDIRASFKAIAALRLEPGRALQDAWYLGRTDQADQVERIFDEYTVALRKHLPPMWGASPINRHSLVWGSWNDGIRRDMDQARLLRTAAFLAKHFPTVQWMQIDDGYARQATDLDTAHGLGMPYEGEAGLAREKFPDGLRAFTDRVRETGIRPAIWIGGFVPHPAPLYRDHPEWFSDYSYRVSGRSPLDVSRPDVRAYMEQALDFFFRESGFEGMKHDFWSYAFEDSHALLSNHSASGYEWRAWWLKAIRERIPDDGYLQTGCDIVMGNPFLGQYFTNYRYGIDIGSGKWEYVKTNFLWGTACFALHVGDLIVPNSDSVGLFPGLTDEEALLCINYCLITRSMVEIAGWLYDADPAHPRFQRLRKAVCCPNNGQDVYFAGYDYRTSDEAPAVWYLKTPHFSLREGAVALPLRTVAVFNLRDEPQTFSVRFMELGLPDGAYRVTDVWHGDTRTMSGRVDVAVPAHGSRLLAVSDATAGPQILDADLRVNSVQTTADALRVRFSYSGPLTLTLSEAPAQVAGVEDPVLTAGPGNWTLRGMVASGVEVVLTFPASASGLS